MKCKEREKIASSHQILEPSLRKRVFKHERDTSGGFHHTARCTLMETVMPGNVTVSMNMYVSSRSA